VIFVPVTNLDVNAPEFKPRRKRKIDKASIPIFSSAHEE